MKTVQTEVPEQLYVEQLPARSSLHIRPALLREVLDRLRREFRDT